MANGSSLEVNAKSSLSDKRAQFDASAMTGMFSAKLDGYINDKMLAFKVDPFLPTYLTLTNEDIKDMLNQNPATGMYSAQMAMLKDNFFGFIFDQDNPEAKKYRDFGLKMAKLYINSIKDEYFTDTKDVEYNGKLVSGKFRKSKLTCHWTKSSTSYLA